LEDKVEYRSCEQRTSDRKQAIAWTGLWQIAGAREIGRRLSFNTVQLRIRIVQLRIRTAALPLIFGG
jgi:hypothetical protein